MYNDPRLNHLYDPEEPILISEEQKKINGAIELKERYGGIDGDHHKTWVIDQVARVLLGDQYPQWVIDMKMGDDGPNTYDYDEGIAP